MKKNAVLGDIFRVLTIERDLTVIFEYIYRNISVYIMYISFYNTLIYYIYLSTSPCLRTVKS